MLPSVFLIFTDRASFRRAALLWRPWRGPCFFLSVAQVRQARPPPALRGRRPRRGRGRGGGAPRRLPEVRGAAALFQRRPAAPPRRLVAASDEDVGRVVGAPGVAGWLLGGEDLVTCHARACRRAFPRGLPTADFAESLEAAERKAWQKLRARGDGAVN